VDLGSIPDQLSQYTLFDSSCTLHRTSEVPSCPQAPRHEADSCLKEPYTLVPDTANSSGAPVGDQSRDGPYPPVRQSKARLLQASRSKPLTQLDLCPLLSSIVYVFPQTLHHYDQFSTAHAATFITRQRTTMLSSDSERPSKYQSSS
jgi:hypothetical protein